MARLLSNLSNYLQSVDALMNEQLGEQEQSATEIRSQRRSRMQADDAQQTTEDGSQASEAEVPPGSTGSGSAKPESAAPVEAPASQSSATRGSAPASNAMLQKDREIELLNREILELEDRCKSLQAEVEDTWKTYKAAQEKAAIREGELHDEINSLKRAKEADKQQYLVGVEALQSEIASLKTQIRGMSQEEDRFHAKIALLQQELAVAREEADGLRTQLHQTRETEVLSVSSVREELRLAQQQVEELRTQHATWQRNAQKRELELEKRNEELVASLTQKTRELEAIQSAFQEDHAASLLNATIDELRREINQLKTQLSTESQEKQALTRQLLVVDGELTRLKTSQESELRALMQTNRDLTAKIEAQERQLQELESAKSGAAHQQELLDLRQKLQSTTEQLLRKQTSLTELQTERSALRATIQDLKLRNQRLEQQLDHSRDIEDDSSFARDSKDKTIRRRNPSRRHDGIGRALEPMGVNQNVVKAVEAVDSWSLLAGSFLRANPFARFGFLLYLIVLHLWVFVVLSMKTSALQDAMTDAPVDSTNINPT